MGRIDKNELGARQQMIMKCIWSLGGKATIQEIIAEMEKRYGVRLSGQSMNTMAGMLIEKGLLTKGKKIHQAFIYEATITEDEFRIREMQRIQKLTFDGSTSAMVAALLQMNITEEELLEIEKLLEEKNV